MTWLRARGRGFPVRDGLVVPIVPAAVIFDLGAGLPDQVWPGPEGAVAACEASGTEIPEGSIGVGAGATIGKAAGITRAMKSGVGTAAARGGDVVVGALVVVNAVGDVRDERGAILAGARNDDGTFLDARGYLAMGGAMFGGREAPAPPTPSHNTTLAVVATNAALTKLDLQGLAGAAADALAGCITPFATAFDGDIVFAASTAAVPPASPLQAEALAAQAVPEAVRRAVRLARGVPGLPGLADRPSPPARS